MDLDGLIEAHPLPDGVPDAIMNREELANAFGVSLPTITDWISAGMPVQQVGERGKPYELRLAACWAWRQAKRRMEETRSEQVRAAQQAMRLALVGGGLGESIDALDPKQKREIIAAQREQELFARDRNALIPRGDVKDAFELTFALIRDALEAMPDRLERAHALPPHAVSTLIDLGDQTINAIAERLDQFWSNRPLRNERNQNRDLFDS